MPRCNGNSAKLPYFRDTTHIMFFLYDLLARAAQMILPVTGKFSSKMKLFVDGRKDVFETLSRNLKPNRTTFWFHAASLGEYEQGLPVMEFYKKHFPDLQIVLTFFSPSGFEVRKNNVIADVTVYLPLDTKANAQRFLDLVKPEIVFFIKYEFWPNYLNELKNRNIRTFLISGIFRHNQVFFKPYGKFYRKSLDAFEHFFVQNDSSKILLSGLGKTNVTVSGDTRFDRVQSILERDNHLDFIERFIDGKKTIVVGSSWPKDEVLLAEYINNSGDVKFIIAPHNIKEEQIQNLRSSLKVETVLFSEMKNSNLASAKVFIVDTIGILTKIYSYADIAYVGGGFGNPGVHNILEPATFGIPIVIGPNFSHFAEAIALVNLKGALVIENSNDLKRTFDQLLKDEILRAETGQICKTFVQMNTNATKSITQKINYGH